MTIDYAKRQPQPPVNRRRLWVIGLVILAFVLAIPTLFYVHYLHMPHFHNHNIVTQPITKDKKTAHISAQSSTDNFDFYSMLPKMTVDIKKGTTGLVQIPQGQPYYLLQVATSSNQKAAEALVTRLGVMGLNAFIKTISNKSGRQQFQIVVGPYLKNNNASTDQAYLRTNHLNSIKLKIINSPK